MISVRSEVQVLPGPPFLRRLSGAVAQLGERLLCKQDVVGSIPSGSTNRCREDETSLVKKTRFAESFGLPPVLYDIVKRRFVRVPHSESGPGRSITFRKRPGADGCGSSSWTLNPRHMIGCLTAPANRSREAGLFCQFLFGAIRMGIGNENDQVS